MTTSLLSGDQTGTWRKLSNARRLLTRISARVGPATVKLASSVTKHCRALRTFHGAYASKETYTRTVGLRTLEPSGGDDKDTHFWGAIDRRRRC